MLRPSIDDLLEEVDSRFELTVVIAKRARQLQIHPEDYRVKEPVGEDINEVARALEELYAHDLPYFANRETMDLVCEQQIAEATSSAEVNDAETIVLENL